MADILDQLERAQARAEFDRNSGKFENEYYLRVMYAQVRLLQGSEGDAHLELDKAERLLTRQEVLAIARKLDRETMLKIWDAVNAKNYDLAVSLALNV